MLNTLVLGAAFMLGQTDAPSALRVQLLTSPDGNAVVQPAAQVLPASAPTYLVTQPVTGALGGACGQSCGTSCGAACNNGCDVQWLKPWKCEDLEMKPAEHKARCNSCGFLHGLLYCPKEDDKANGKDEKKNGKEEKKEEKKNGDAEEPAELTPLMQAIKCRAPFLFEQLECRGAKIYGWTQFGYTFNTDSPRDRLNFGTTFNNRSNDITWNQVPYFVVEKALDLDKKKDEWHMGYRVDFAGGHDVPYWENIGLGWFDRFTGDRLETSRLTEYGIGIPQFYVNMHAPILTDRGVDFFLGRHFTHQTFELSPAPQTYFYSHTYEYFHGMPFTHLSAEATVHIGDTVDVMVGISRGWDVVFQDTNDSYSWLGLYTWNSCDKRQSVVFSWMTGPEQLQNNHNDRTTLTVYYTRKFGACDEWRWVVGGCVGWEQNAALSNEGTVTSAEWYATHTYLFYDLNKKTTLGTRFEWFRDDDGTRTALANSDNGGASWNRPGYAGNFFDLTFGVTYKPYQNLRLRPELRFDWFDGPVGAGAPFNDQRDRFQTTLAMDVIWEF